jgi:hypothetical protein
MGKKKIFPIITFEYGIVKSMPLPCQFPSRTGASVFLHTGLLKILGIKWSWHGQVCLSSSKKYALADWERTHKVTAVNFQLEPPRHLLHMHNDRLSLMPPSLTIPTQAYR